MNFFSWSITIVWFIWRLTVESPGFVLTWVAIIAAIFGLGYWVGS